MWEGKLKQKPTEEAGRADASGRLEQQGDLLLK